MLPRKHTNVSQALFLPQTFAKRNARKVYKASFEHGRRQVVTTVERWDVLAEFIDTLSLCCNVVAILYASDIELLSTQ